MLTRSLLISVLFTTLAGLSLTACAPEIGDECESSLDCPSGAFCDTTIPDGYCTARGCETDSQCSEESICVRFDRFESYCMLSCSSSSDCRSGHVCRDDVEGKRFCYLPLESDESGYSRAPSSDAVIGSPDVSPEDLSDPGDATDATDATDTTDPGDATDATDTTDPGDATDATDTADSGDTTDTAEPADATDTADSGDATDTAP